jgi:hypothetical protein
MVFAGKVTSGPFACGGCGGVFHATPKAPAIAVDMNIKDLVLGRVVMLCDGCARAKLTHAMQGHEIYLDGSMP